MGFYYIIFSAARFFLNLIIYWKSLKVSEYWPMPTKSSSLDFGCSSSSFNHYPCINHYFSPVFCYRWTIWTGPLNVRKLFLIFLGAMIIPRMLDSALIRKYMLEYLAVFRGMKCYGAFITYFQMIQQKCARVCVCERERM